MPQRKIPLVSEIFKKTLEQHVDDKVAVGSLLNSLHERGFALLMALFALPNCVPVPIPPGISTILGAPLLFFSIQMVLGRDAPWLPAWLAKKQIPRSLLALAVNKAVPLLQKAEIILTPRALFLSSSRGERLVGVSWLIFSLAIASPIPLSHFVPSMGVMLSALGLINRDGAFVFIGLLIGYIGMLITTLVLFFGVELVKQIFSF